MNLRKKRNPRKKMKIVRETMTPKKKKSQWKKTRKRKRTRVDQTRSSGRV